MVVERASKGCNRSNKKRLNCGVRIDQSKVELIIVRSEMKRRK